MIRRLNEITLTLLTHASLPPNFWVEALHTACYLHNILPTNLLKFQTPASALYLRKPSYSHLRVFGCACYPNASSTRPHKLALRSSLCIFLGYPADFRGYRCLDLSTGKIILSRHVTFDETTFPYSTKPTPSTHSYSFLDPDPSPLFTQPHYPLTTTTSPASPPAPSPPPTSHSVTPPTSSPPPPPPPMTHHMTTRSRDGTRKPKTPFNLNVQTAPAISPLPTSHLKALSDPNWNAAMTEEYRALMDNNTWVLVPRPPDTNVIRCMWLFRHKFNSQGAL